MIIKIVINEPFRGLTSGWATRFVGLTRELARSNDLIIYAPGDNKNLRKTFPNCNICESTSENYGSYRFDLLNYIYSLVFRTGDLLFTQYKHYYDFDRLLHDNNDELYDVGLCFGLDTYVYYGRYFYGHPVLCDFCDSILRQLKSNIRETKNLRKKLCFYLDTIHLKNTKRRFIPQELIISAITQQDAKCIKKTLRKNKVVTIGNGVSTPTKLHFNDDYIKEKWKSKVVIFCGSLNYEPNRNSIQYIVKKIWPEIKKIIPELEFHIIGRNPDEQIMEYEREVEGVKVYGNVKSVFHYYKNAKVLLVPMFLGSGMKNKILEAYCTGTPVITNEEGATGISMKTGENGFIAKDDREIIDSFMKIYNSSFDRYKKWSTNNYLLSKQYSWEKMGTELLSKLEACSTEYAMNYRYRYGTS